MRYGLFLLDEGPKSAVLPDRKQHRQRTTPTTPTTTWRKYARRSLGTPFPASTPVTARAVDDQGDRYRELVQKAQVRLSGVAKDKTQHTRVSACQAYAHPIQRELEETRLFLSKLSVDKPAPLIKSDVDENVADTLAKVEQMRYDFENQREQKKKADEAEKAEAVKKVEDAKQAEETKKAEATKKAAEEVKQAEEAEKAKQAEEAKQAIEQSKPIETPTTSEQAVLLAKRYRDMYSELMNDLAPKIRADPQKRAHCFKQRGLVTRGVGQLKDSWEFIGRTADSIKSILSASASADVQDWMLNLVAKSLVKQAEREVSVAPHAAYPLAATAVLVMQAYPKLSDMLMIRLVKKCPFVVPQYMAKQPGQNTDDFIKAAGYRRNDDGDIESEGIYAERMTGMLALFAAIVQMPDIGGQPNPFPVHHGWTWLARIINMPPRAISPLLVQTFLSVAGPTMLGVYGRQMDKLISVLATTWIASVAGSSPLAVAGKSNLTTFINEYRSSGSIRECKGRVIKTR
ncbi:Nuclear pore complex nucleoporin component [Coemansia sp. RSA 1797]|nr:Nuclear pore complex nucleoporin component [Coemansia sp. RSA 1797]